METAALGDFKINTYFLHYIYSNKDRGLNNMNGIKNS